MLTLDLCLYAMETTETLNNLFASLEKNAAYSAVANESSAYYSVANEGFIDTIKSIGRTICDFILSIIHRIQDAFDRFVNAIRKK